MVREGKFKLHATGPNHCGLKERMEVRYSMTCVCSANSLDNRGFLFDQVNVDQFFQGIKKTELSCEKLVVECSRQLWRLIRKENPSCKIQRISLTLSPEPFAARMTFDYKESRHKAA